MRELQWALRRLKSRPAFSVTFVGILGVVLGIMLTVGTLADASIGASLPYDHEETLYAIAERQPDQGIERMVSSLSSIADWQESAHAFSTLGGVRPQITLTLAYADGVERVTGAVVTASMFDVLGVTPILGRPFAADEDRAAADIPVVILSHALWKERFAADPAILNRTVTLNGGPWTVVGVLPPGQSLAPHEPEPVDVWLPVGVAGRIDGNPVYTNRSYRMYQMIARLAPGVTEDEVNTELATMSARLAAAYPQSSTGWTWFAESLRSRVLGGAAPAIRALTIGAFLLVLVALVNVLALYAQRMSAEQRELITRMILGAGVGDVSRLAIVELALLAALSGGLGVLISAAAVPLLPRWLPLTLPVHVHVNFNWALALIGVGALSLVLMAAGGAGLWVSVRGLHHSAGVGNRVVGTSSASSRASRAMLGTQIAFTTLLAIGSATAVRSFLQLADQDPGIQPEGLVALRVDMPPELRDAQQVPVTAEEILRRLEELPTVRRSFLWSPHVPTAASWFTRVRLFDRPDIPDSELPAVRINSVSPGAVAAIGMEIVAGRDLEEADRTAGHRVVVISSTAAKQWWGGPRNAVGQRIRRWNHDDWSEVVGVAADAPLSGRQGDGSDFFTDVYFLFPQDLQRSLVFFAQAEHGASLDAPSLRAAVQAAASDLPVYDVRSMDARLADQESISRGSALLSVVFAATAVLLAALGLYGGLSFVISRRRRELGLRQALGASPTRVVSELVWSNSGIIGAGLSLGTVTAWFVLTTIDPAQLLAGPRDPLSYVLAVAALVTTSTIAVMVPALRAVRTSPADSLRQT